MKILKIVLCIIAALSIVGCTYEEGDDVAEASFQLMTTQEKAMHDKVMGEFGQKAVRSIREAVGKRKFRPNENSQPFIDIANVIRFCDDNILVPENFKNGTDAIKKAMKSKFSSQDREWWRRIVMMAMTDPINTNLPEVKEEPKFEIKKFASVTVKQLKVEEERVTVNSKDLLPLSKYQDVKFLARGCDQAISIIESAASKDRPLTEEDFNNIQYEKAVCETKKLNENL